MKKKDTGTSQLSSHMYLQPTFWLISEYFCSDSTCHCIYIMTEWVTVCV